MAIIGNIIKGIIHASDIISVEYNAAAEQRAVLKNLLRTAEHTKFGKHYSFTEILNSNNPEKTFSAKVPFSDYNQITSNWWQYVQKGEENITWPNSPDYFALSSGTTGKTSKRIPVTDDMVKAIRNAGIQQVLALKNFDLPADFFEKEIMMLGSSTDLEEHNNALEGEISGISASNIPFWFQNYYKPGKEIAQIADWDKRVQRIAEKASEWDIGALSGIPSWMELMLQKVIEYNNLNNIHEIWPNLQVYTSGGVAFGPYKKSFNALLGKPITVIDTYLASEGFIAFQQRPETDAMKLVTDNGIYFEFVPFSPDYIKPDGSLVQNAPALTISEVELNQDYVLILSSVAGAWRYIIGDTIEFTDIERAEIKITGRTKFFLNTVGSQLSVNKLNDAVQHLEKHFDIEIQEYTLCANRINDDFYHCWYLGTNAKLSTTKLANELDDFLMNANKNYKVARSKALEGIKVSTVLPSVFHEWSGSNKKKGGQVKMERVMGQERFKDWEDFVLANS
ncbi:GH3 auxin-responsive promoter [Cellulophaga geojensis KL-A]|uniref:GH3 auxin-responsive promoter n=1 Tax=Cellulophaga geojensis KL-A TaxID=1328323 RepID=A0ABN0RRB5_9FLAO|nr:GH3 auxin-responsive promoter family protein [Cellulophaga geojensis]EWH14392.1 GH3 auxin-responsive promoter [Cellulophaga geojensis KL-A]